MAITKAKNTEETLSECFKLLEIIIAIPMTATESERWFQH